MRRKICVVTGSRAEYGILKPLLQTLKKDRDIKLQLVVTGMHLSSEFGLTFKEIEKDGFTIDAKIKIPLDTDTGVGLTEAMGKVMVGFSKVCKKLTPDIIVVLGDRFEIFSVAVAAFVNRIIIAHIHGGELTEGAFDDSFRHAITKMSRLHFTSTEEYRRRVIQLGEEPDRVFNVGALGLDNIKRLKLLSRKELEEKLKFKFKKRNLLVTFHPATLERETPEKQFKNLLSVLEKLDNTAIIFTKANADPGGRVINKLIDEYVAKNPNTSVASTSLGNCLYLSIMHYVDGVVGNSSSGIIEAPSFKIGTINIGDRQKGRVKAPSVIDCGPTPKSIEKALERLYSSRFQKDLEKVINPYGDGNTARRIKEILKNYELKHLLKKHFYQINFPIDTN